MEKLFEERIGLVGFGVSNEKLLERLVKDRDSKSLFVSDSGKIKEEGRKLLKTFDIEFEEGGHTDRLFDCDAFIVSPGVSPFSEVGKRIICSGKYYTTELEVSLGELWAKPRGTVIGVTGTNGKSTTVTMLKHILSGKNRKVFQGGNLGDPLAGVAEEVFDYYVLEVSSFQLRWFSEERIRFHLSAIINLGEDHLDYHRSIDDYFKSKLRLAKMTEGITVIPKAVAECQMGFLKGSRLRPFVALGGGLDSFDREHLRVRGVEFKTSDLPFTGLHNYENVLVVLLISQLIGLSAEDVFRELKSYTFLSHRLQLVRELEGVKYYDDSKATNAHAVSAALRNFEPSKTILILGGKEKDETYSELIEQLGQLKHVVMLGSSMKILSAKLQMRNIPVSGAANMADAVKICRRLAMKGDYVVLSPAGSSYDLYRNYGERGNHFREIVNTLE
ncbi:MAG: UDP-N-acetylmuramoyl-L-alanine--D-glutamate ligase [Kosmotogaceae bacterium]|nr:UDP-N-acetylmuramoyl-L-alanine--D-glutamate ligase [Kosmotogaceae bacterium]